MGTVFYRRLSRWQAETEREDIAGLYTEAMAEAPGARVLDREEFLRRFVDHDVQQPGFDLVVASDPAPVGCAYGFRADQGSAWWASFPDVPTELRELSRASRMFVVAGLLVAPRQRRRQIGSRLLRELLARSGALVALTLLDPGNSPARSAFQSWGWSKSGQLTPASGGPPAEAWARRLGI